MAALLGHLYQAVRHLSGRCVCLGIAVGSRILIGNRRGENMYRLHRGRLRLKQTWALHTVSISCSSHMLPLMHILCLTPL